MDLAKTHSAENRVDRDLEEINDLVIIGYSPIGSVTGPYGSIEVHARETVMAASRLVEQYVRLEISSSGDYPQTSIGNIYSKNIDNFLSSLEKLERTNIDKDRYEFTEVQFELNDIKTTVFNNSRNDLMWACQCEGISIHFNSLNKIGELRDLIAKAKAHLDRRKI